MHFVDASEVARVLTFPVLIAAFEEAHRRRKAQALDGYLGSEDAQFVLRGAVDRGRCMACKMFTSFPANLGAGKLPAVQAVYVAGGECPPEGTRAARAQQGRCASKASSGEPASGASTRALGGLRRGAISRVR